MQKGRRRKWKGRWERRKERKRSDKRGPTMVVQEQGSSPDQTPKQDFLKNEHNTLSGLSIYPTINCRTFMNGGLGSFLAKPEELRTPPPSPADLPEYEAGLLITAQGSLTKVYHFYAHSPELSRVPNNRNHKAMIMNNSKSN
jgi:hypothetical protein